MRIFGALASRCGLEKQRSKNDEENLRFIGNVKFGAKYQKQRGEDPPQQINKEVFFDGKCIFGICTNHVPT